MISVQLQQILVPKSVYIGDTAELQCTFNYNSQTFDSLTQDGSANLPIANFSEPLNLKEYEIKNITLTSVGVDYYQLTITFIPWKTGEIQIPQYLINDVPIDFEPITIGSITEQNSITSLQNSTAPLLLPGTTYKLYGVLIFSVAFLFFLIRIIVRHKQVMFFIKNQQLKIRYKKNAKLTRKKLKMLLDKNQSSKEISSEIQKIMRHYLEVRFEYPFTKSVTSEMMKGFYASTAGLLAEEKELAFEEFVSIFVRTDFLRYSNHAEFLENEKKELIEKLIKNIDIIETPTKEKNEKEIENGGANNV